MMNVYYHIIKATCFTEKREGIARTYWELVARVKVTELDHHWSRQWLATYDRRTIQTNAGFLSMASSATYTIKMQHVPLQQCNWIVVLRIWFSMMSHWAKSVYPCLNLTGICNSSDGRCITWSYSQQNCWPFVNRFKRALNKFLYQLRQSHITLFMNTNSDLTVMNHLHNMAWQYWK